MDNVVENTSQLTRQTSVEPYKTTKGVKLGNVFNLKSLLPFMKREIEKCLSESLKIFNA